MRRLVGFVVVLVVVFGFAAAAPAEVPMEKLKSSQTAEEWVKQQAEQRREELGLQDVSRDTRFPGDAGKGTTPLGSPYAEKNAGADSQAAQSGGGNFNVKISNLDLSGVTGKLLDLSNWFLGAASILLAVIAMYRGLAIAFSGGRERRSEAMDSLLQLVIGGSLVFGSWLVVAVLRNFFLK